MTARTDGTQAFSVTDSARWYVHRGLGLNPKEPTKLISVLDFQKRLNRVMTLPCHN